MITHVAIRCADGTVYAARGLPDPQVIAELISWAEALPLYTACSPPDWRGATHGFLKDCTSTRVVTALGNVRFLTRIEAGAHALICGQVERLTHPPRLYARDIWP